jgi:hypothetical protein
MRRKSQKNSEKSGETEIMQTTIDRITARRTFEPFDRPTIGCRFHRFKKRGESIEGMLGWPVPNFRQGTSYPLETDDGEIIEIVANKLLHKQINKGELCGQRVRIQYEGREFVGFGLHRKIYRVFKVPWPTIFTREQWNKLIKEQKKRSANNGQNN